MSAAVELREVTRTFNKVRAVDDISFSVAEGEFFAMLGPSGCGKTTTLRMIAGFEQPTAGRILLEGNDVSRTPPYKRDVNTVFQNYALFPHMDVFDNVAYGLRARGQDATAVRRKVGEALERVGLGALAQRLPAALSGGQRQRVALARALVIQPQVLLMDEPLSNLDAKLRLQVRQTIAELQAEAGITTVFVTHDQDEALALSHQIGVMNKGRLEQVGTPAQIYREPATAYVADFVGAANLLPVTLGQPVAAGGSTSVPVGGVEVTARAPVAVAAGAATLVARPEDITLGAPQPGALNGRIARRQYLGDKTSYRVDLGSGLQLDVDSHGDAHDRFTPGTEVALHLDPRRTLVLGR